MKPIILASASARRIELMKLTNLPFTPVDSGFDEQPFHGENPETYVETQTIGKANEAGKHYPHAIIVAGDAGVELDGKVFGKPKDRTDAIRMLKLLSGKTHRILSGFAVYEPEKHIMYHGVDIVSVTFKKLTETEIVRYVATKDGMDKAGAYGIQTIRKRFVAAMHGSWSTALGLPIHFVIQNVLLIEPEYGSCLKP